MDCQEKLELLQKEYDDFTYIISHDLKAPIRAISNLTEWIAEDLGSDISQDISQNLEMLNSRAEKLNDMITAVTELSRINRKELDIAEVSLEQLLSNITDDIEYRYPSAKIKIAQCDFTFHTYAKKLQKVLTEVIENAAVHNSENKELEISISIMDHVDFFEIITEDNGKNIMEDQIGNLTKMFYTLESKDKSKTIGAGLAIVKKIIDFVGGTINFGSKEDKFQVQINWPKKIIKDDTKSK